MHMGKPIRILFIEDCETDTLLMCSHLEDGGFDVGYRRVETAAALRMALTTEVWDMAVCDFRIPGFGAEPALEIVRELQPELPFIVASGVVRVGDVVSLLRMGAFDFVEKSDLDRLVIAVERALDRANSGSAEPFRTMVMESPDAILLAETDGRLIFANRRAEELLGYTTVELAGMTYRDLHPDWELDKTRRAFEGMRDYGSGRLVSGIVRRKDGSDLAVDISGCTLVYKGRKVLQGVFRELVPAKPA
ncbi:MAG: PAS domain S-box protein [Magnetospirillum sp. WYHS-4]